MKFGFGDGERVPTCDPDWDSIDRSLMDSTAFAPSEEALREARLEGITRILRTFAAKSNLRAIGQRVVLAAFLAKVGEEKSQRELALRLGLTPGRISQMLKRLRSQLAMAARR